MLETEDHQRIERNVQRTTMLIALRKIRALVRADQEEQAIERGATLVAIVVLGTIAAVALFWFWLSSRPVVPFEIVASSNPAVTRFTPYVEDWAKKVEAVARTSCTSFLSPASPRATVAVTATIRSDGALESVKVSRTSSIEGLDRVALQSVHAAAPFAEFPSEIKKDTDILEITREFQYRYVPCSES